MFFPAQSEHQSDGRGRSVVVETEASYLSRLIMLTGPLWLRRRRCVRRVQPASTCQYGTGLRAGARQQRTAVPFFASRQDGLRAVVARYTEGPPTRRFTPRRF